MKDISMYFEHTIRRFLGDKAYHIAGYDLDACEFRKWLRKCIPVIEKRIDVLETTYKHKELLMSDVSYLDKSLKCKGGGADKEIILRLFTLNSHLLGFGGLSGQIYNEPLYHQSYGQYLREKTIIEAGNDKDWFEIHKEEQGNVVKWRKEAYDFLKNKGLNDSQISFVLNTTPGSIKKLKHGR